MPYPQLVVGGYARAAFTPSSLFADLGAVPLSASEEVDAAGFELVWDCTLEFYTLLAKLLAPPVGDAAGLEGVVTLALPVSADDPTATRKHDVPVRLRLDRVGGDVLRTEVVPLPDSGTWPTGWVPETHVQLRSAAAVPVDATLLPATLVVVNAEGTPTATSTASVQPTSFSLAGPTAAPVLPAPRPLPGPAFPGTPLARGPGVVEAVRTVQTRLNELGAALEADGRFGELTDAAVRAHQQAAGREPTGVVDALGWASLFPGTVAPAWPPPPPPGTVLLRLTADPASAPDPRLVGAVDVPIGALDLHLEPDRVLQRVHEMGSSSDLAATVGVSSYQLAHPETLPPDHRDIFGIDVELRRGAGPAVRVSITRQTTQETVSMPFTFADLAAGLRPDKPSFDYRLRYQEPAGPGQWTDWAGFVGDELRVTPLG